MGYALVPVMFAYEVSFYFMCKRFLGWWMPSSPLADPDVNATLAPWVFCISQALFAGFWEEALFRALPLAAVAIATGSWSRPKRAIVVCVAFMVQSAVFGAAHANYPAQPAHARLVELLLPSVGFGLLYWRWGLLPGVVLHFIYDVVWMALPIFLSDSNALDKSLVVLCASLPLLAPLTARALPVVRPADSGTPTADPLALHRNSNWTPLPNAQPNKDAPKPQPKMAASEATGVATLGAAALVLWLIWLLRVPSSPHMTCANWADPLSPASQAAALQHAAHIPSVGLPAHEGASPPTLGALLEADAAPGASIPAGALHAMPHLRSSRAEWLQHRFVWASKKEKYSALLQAGFLRANEWEVRFARVGENATLAASAGAEEWLVTGLAPRGRQGAAGACGMTHGDAVSHTLPEGRSGMNMSEDVARAAAHKALAAVAIAVVVDDVDGMEVGEGTCGAVRESDTRAVAHPNRTDYVRCKSQTRETSSNTTIRPVCLTLLHLVQTRWQVFNFTCVRDDFGLESVGAEARVGVSVGAGEVSPLVLSLQRFVKVPEEWSRNDKTQEKMCGVMQLTSRVMMLLGLGAGAVQGVVAWSSSTAAADGALGRSFRKLALGLLLLLGMSACNQMPNFQFGLSTAQPFSNQLVSHIGSTVVRLAMQVCILALAALSLSAPSRAPRQYSLGTTNVLQLMAGAGAGVCLHTLRTAFAMHLSDPTYEPTVVDASRWMGYSLPLGLVLAELQHYSMRVILGCLISRALHGLVTAGRSRFWLLLSPRAWVLCCAGAVLLHAKDQAEGAACAAAGSLPLVVFLLSCALMLLQLSTFHHHRQLVPVAVAAHHMMDLGNLLASDTSAYDRAAQLSLLGAVICVLALGLKCFTGLAMGQVRDKQE